MSLQHLIQKMRVRYIMLCLLYQDQSCYNNFKTLQSEGGPFVQIVHINSNHWVTTTNVGCASDSPTELRERCQSNAIFFWPK